MTPALVWGELTYFYHHTIVDHIRALPQFLTKEGTEPVRTPLRHGPTRASRQAGVAPIA